MAVKIKGLTVELASEKVLTLRGLTVELVPEKILTLRGLTVETILSGGHGQVITRNYTK